MGWIDKSDVLNGALADARATMARLGHRSAGFGPTNEPGVLMACCPMCWMVAWVRVRLWGKPGTSGAALNLRCEPEAPPRGRR